MYKAMTFVPLAQCAHLSKFESAIQFLGLAQLGNFAIFRVL